MNFTLYLFSFSLILLSACYARKPDSAGLIEKQLSIILPIPYEVLENEYITLEVVPSEYQIKVTLKFDQNGLQELEKQIKSSSYYNKLAKFKLSSKGLALMNEEIQEYADVKDYLAIIKSRGSWVKNGELYEYIDILGPDNGEPVKASINKKDRTLSFDYMNI